MLYNTNSNLWPDDNNDYFRNNVKFQPIRQKRDACVSTSLAILTGKKPEYFEGKMNTQDPVSWSKVLKPFGMKLAYCPTDIRKLQFYLDELIRLDDLFLLCYYIPTEPDELLGDPNDEGWVRGSHVVILHRDKIIDPAGGVSTDARSHLAKNRHTKRIFRVVPTSAERGL